MVDDASARPARLRAALSKDRGFLVAFARMSLLETPQPAHGTALGRFAMKLKKGDAHDRALWLNLQKGRLRAAKQQAFHDALESVTDTIRARTGDIRDPDRKIGATLLVSDAAKYVGLVATEPPGDYLRARGLP